MIIDFEDAAEQSALAPEEWQRRCETDLGPLLKHAVLLAVRARLATGRARRNGLGSAWTSCSNTPSKFRRAIGTKQDLRG